LSATILDLITQAMSSPWLYAALFTLAALDAFVIVLPSEGAVITAGVFAATGGPELLPIMAAAAAGAMAGDHFSYALGRRYGTRFVDRLPDHGRRRTAFDWAGNALQQRGGTALVVARYVPGGRTAVTLTTGAIRFPFTAFVRYDALAAVSWAVYCALVGYIGGTAFEENPLYGVLLGIALALTLAASLELIRARRSRPAGSAPSVERPAPAAPAPDLARTRSGTGR
jgi:membrane protein DedA with SNARE-associated domain